MPALTKDQRLAARAAEAGWISAEALVTAALAGSGQVLDELLRSGQLSREQLATLRAAGADSAATAVLRAGAAIEASEVALAETRGGATVDVRPTSSGAPRGGGVGEMVTLAPVDGAGQLDPLAAAGADAELADKYRIEREIGRGGMGVVLECADQHVRRFVALKVLREEYVSQPEMNALLMREARLTGQLEHPNIIPVYDLGRLPDGRRYYTMKLVREVRTLDTVLGTLRMGQAQAEHDYPLVRLLSIFAQVCMGMSFAHARGVVHRDLKPANILIGDFGEVQIMDWGVAAVRHSALPDDPLLGPLPVAAPPADGAPGLPVPPERISLIGTPQYMSPAQARGEPGDDPTTDLYALGVILYELLTLKLPYESTQLDGLLDDICQGRIIPVERRNPARSVPPELAAIVARALAHDPAEAWPSARALFEAVEAFVQGTRELARLRELAAEHAAAGQVLLADYLSKSAEHAALLARVESQRAALRPWHPQAQRRLLWAAEAELAEIEYVKERLFSRSSDAFVQALGYQSDRGEAREALRQLCWSKVEPAVAAGRIADVLYFGNLIRRYASADADVRGQKPGFLTVRSVPDGTRILLNHVDRPAQDEPDPGDREIGVTPLIENALPPGIYVLVAQAAGFKETKRAFVLRSGGTVEMLVTLDPWEQERPMVGREAELGRLKAGLRSAMDNRRPVFFVVTGAVGMGRSRLHRALEQHLRDIPDDVYYFRAEPRRTHPFIPFAPMADMLAFRAGIRHDEPPAVRQRKVGQMVRHAFSDGERHPLSPADAALAETTARNLCLLPGLVEAKAYGELPPGYQPRDVRRRIFDGVRTYFQALGRSAPLYLSVRWMDRLDASTVALLTELRSLLVDTPLMLVGDRMQGLPPSDLDDAAEHIALDPLQRLDVERLACEYLDGGVTARMVDVLYERTAGKPYHLTALLAVLAEKELLRRVDGRFDLVDAVSRVADLPDYAAAIEELTLRTLSTREVLLLKRAAVAGRIFSRDELVALGERDPDPLLDDLVAREVLLTRPTAGVLWTVVYSFATLSAYHALLSRLDEDERRRLHGELARYWGSRPDPEPEALALTAFHGEEAGLAATAAEAYERLTAHARAFAAGHEAAMCQERAVALRVQGAGAIRRGERV